MKVSWGYKIAGFYLVFVTGIMWLVFQSSQQKVDLVTQDYYAQELRYQERIDQTKRASGLSAPLQIMQHGRQVSLQFPAEFNGKKISGSVVLYCPSNKDMDISTVLQTVNNQMQWTIPEKNQGLHELQVSWESEGKTYYFSKTLFVE
jgi:hypothetical protein